MTEKRETKTQDLLVRKNYRTILGHLHPDKWHSEYKNNERILKDNTTTTQVINSLYAIYKRRDRTSSLPMTEFTLWIRDENNEPQGFEATITKDITTMNLAEVQEYISGLFSDFINLINGEWEETEQYKEYKGPVFDESLTNEERHVLDELRFIPDNEENPLGTLIVKLNEVMPYENIYPTIINLAQKGWIEIYDTRKVRMLKK